MVDPFFMKNNQHRQLARELRLQKEAKKELKRRIRRRRARAAGLNPSLLPKLRLKATEFAKGRGVFLAQHPSFQHLLRVPAGIAVTTRKLVGALRGGGRTGVIEGRDGGAGAKALTGAAARTRSNSRSRGKNRSRSRSPVRKRGRKRPKPPENH